MKINLLNILIFISACNLLQAQEKYSVEVEERIKQVESSLLLGRYEVEGETDASLKERMAFYKIQGLSVAVINNYKVEWAKGYGWADSAEGRPVTSETIFEPGSISKSLNTIGVLKLAQEGKIDLNADINQYLKTWKFPYDKKSKGKKITTANLLSHMAGLSVHGFPGYYYGDTFPSVSQILNGKRPANSEAVRSQFAPGVKYQYSGGGSMISEMILTDISQQAYDKYQEENVFKPLDMTNSFFTQPPPIERRNQLATAYGHDGKEIKGKYPILIEQAAGGLWTTPTDLCKFIIEIQLSLKGESNKVLSKEMTKRMLTTVADAERDSVGLGVFFPKTKIVKYFSHGAGNQGFRGVYFGSFENGKGAVAFINSEQGAILSELTGSIARVYNWDEFARSEKRKAIAVPDSVIAKYEGIYKAGEVISSVVRTKEGYRLFVTNKYWKMCFTSDSTFFNRESGSDKCFVRDGKDGYKMVRTMNGKTVNIGEKIKIIMLSDKVMDEYTGRYALDGSVDVVKLDGELWMSNGQEKLKMRFYQESEFFLDEAPECIFIFHKKNGEISELEQKGPSNFKGKKIK